MQRRCPTTLRKDADNQGRILLTLSMTQWEAGYLHDMLTTCSDAIAIFRETGDRHNEGMALNSLGLAMMNTQKFKEAISAFRNAWAIFRESGDLENADKALANLKIAASLAP